MKILKLTVLLAVLGLMSAALAFGAPMSGAADEPIDEPGLEECMPAFDGDECARASPNGGGLVFSRQVQGPGPSTCLVATRARF